MNSDQNGSPRPFIAAGTTLGIGLGGFLDGIVFHQLLQLHNMLSAKYPVRGVDVKTLAVHLEVNMFWDGLFHAFCWIVTALGLLMLWREVRVRDVPMSGKMFVGSLLLGWGIFNLVEGLIDHHLLHLHHVIEAPNHLPWDLAFLGSGIAFLLIGWLLIRADRTDVTVVRNS